jgi:hypothetical protein
MNIEISDLDKLKPVNLAHHQPGPSIEFRSGSNMSFRCKKAQP